MAATVWSVGDALTMEHWAKELALTAEKKSYFTKFIGTSYNNMIVARKELDSNPGAKITVGLLAKLAGDGVYGDDTIEDTSAEEALATHSDIIYVNQIRKGIKIKGKMTEQMALFDLRARGKEALSTWFSEYLDECITIYLSGARGVDTSFKVGTGWTGDGVNSVQTAESTHLIFAGTATTTASICATHTMNLSLLEQCIVHSKTIDPMIQPLMVEGQQKFIMLMHPYSVYDLRTSTSSNDWLDIHKYLDRGDAKSPIYTGALGEYGGVVLHQHRNVIQFDNYGSSGTLAAARNLFLGAQAGIIAFAQGGAPTRFKWNEETFDRGNGFAITAGVIWGVKKTRFNSKDFGLIAVDCYAASPL